MVKKLLWIKGWGAFSGDASVPGSALKNNSSQSAQKASRAELWERLPTLGLLLCLGVAVLCYRNANDNLTHLAAQYESGAALLRLDGVGDAAHDLTIAYGWICAAVILASGALFSAINLLILFRARQRLRASEMLANRLATHDALSGLPNRRHFDQAADAAMAAAANTGARTAMIFIDLDQFKEVNDSYGHDAGDQLICAVAKRIGDVLPPGDSLARLGGDEFAVISAGLADKDAAEALAYRIVEQFAEPFDLAGRKINSSASLGVAVAPEDATERSRLAQCADAALYRAKNDGRNRYRLYDHRIGEEQQRRITIERDLRQAITDSSLDVVYQPIYAADARRMVGVEALLRWKHPQLGALAPDFVVSVAEERGLIRALGEWVLRRACRDANAWPDLKLAVNVSPIQFRHRSFVGDVARILRETGFDPAHLELELTEGVIVSDADLAENCMTELRAMGIRMALDDFGVGYSSLIYLRRFPFDKIKIDRSFLEAVESTGEGRVLVDSVVNLGRALGLIVTAEGVETLEQLRILQSVGCHELQGYLMSRPAPAHAITALQMLPTPAPASGAPRAVA